MSREEYIKEYGDVFESSINILNLPDSEFVGAELTDSEKRLLEERAKRSNEHLAEEFPGERESPREVGDTFYQDLMDRAEAGEDIKFGMPYVFSDFGPDTHHEGRHRMAELFARGHGDTPLPVKVMRGTHG